MPNYQGSLEEETQEKMEGKESGHSLKKDLGGFHRFNLECQCPALRPARAKGQTCFSQLLLERIGFL